MAMQAILWMPLLTDYNSEVPIESETVPVKKDTGTAKSKPEPPAKPLDKKENKRPSTTAADKPDDKGKKPVKNEKPKSGGGQ